MGSGVSGPTAVPPCFLGLGHRNAHVGVNQSTPPMADRTSPVIVIDAPAVEAMFGAVESISLGGGVSWDSPVGRPPMSELPDRRDPARVAVGVASPSREPSGSRPRSASCSSLGPSQTGQSHSTKKSHAGSSTVAPTLDAPWMTDQASPPGSAGAPTPRQRGPTLLRRRAIAAALASSGCPLCLSMVLHGRTAGRPPHVGQGPPCRMGSALG
jgi:hypothetical protein